MSEISRTTGLVGYSGMKVPVRAATTAAITLSGEQTIDGIACVTGDRVLVKDQASAIANGIYCVDPATEILTRRGFKNYGDLVAGEDVFTLNMRTGRSEWQPLLSVHDFHVSDTEMLRMEGNCHSSLSTLNHRWPVSCRSAPLADYPRKRRANGTFEPWPQPLGEYYLTIKESADLNTEDYILLSAECANLPETPVYSDALVELVGWFITEGHIRKLNSGTLSTCVDIVQSQAVNPQYVARIRTALQSLFGPAVKTLKHPHNRVWKAEWREDLVINGRMVEFALNREAGKVLCDLAPGKVAKPEFIAALTKPQLDIFIDACIAADGSVSSISGQRVFVQKRLDMLAPVQMACALRGIPTNVKRRRDSGIHVMTLLKRQRALPIRNGERVRYSGTVWCPKTENKTWLARRDGSIYFTGNTVDTGDWERSSDADGSYDFVSGSLVPIAAGTVSARAVYMLTTTGTITPGTTSLTFAAMGLLAAPVPIASGGTGAITAGAARTALDVPSNAEAILDALLTTTGDSIEASAASTPARKAASATVAAHATTMNPWVARVVTLSGSAVTFTDIADAAYVGQQVLLIMNAAHVWTDGAVFDVQGGATYTTAAGDQVLLVATAVDAFDVTIIPATGNLVIRLGTEQATTSGTSIDFTGIPAGTKRIKILLKGVSTNGTSLFLVQLGDSGGIETSGYLGGTGSATNTAGFLLNITGAAAGVWHGVVTLELENAASFSWIQEGSISRSDTATNNSTAGSKDLSAELTQVRITTVNGTDAFDAGAINISYE